VRRKWDARRHGRDNRDPGPPARRACWIVLRSVPCSCNLSYSIPSRIAAGWKESSLVVREISLDIQLVAVAVRRGSVMAREHGPTIGRHVDGCAEYTKTDDRHGLGPVCRSIRRSPVASLPPRNLKPNPRPIPNYASLMEAAKDFNEGMHVPSRREMVWVKKGRGE
jgi:hypothetical protein